MLSNSNIRLQWDPAHKPDGSKEPGRRGIQLGLRGIRSFASGEDILCIEDLSSFVATQHKIFQSGDMESLLTPRETVYMPEDPDAVNQVELTIL
jgi:hypothetical protein